MTVNHETASSDGPAVEESETYTPVGPSKAIQANNAAAVPEVLKSLSEFGSSPLVEDNDVRLRMLVQAKALVRALETPRETMIKHNWAQPGCHAAITACYNAGVFGLLEKPTKVDDIANQLGKPRDILSRLMKHIAAMGYITETGTDEYGPTNFSKALHLRMIGDGYAALAGGAHASCSRFPTFLQESDWQISSDITVGPYQRAFCTELDMFRYMAAHPPLGEQFNYHMSGYRQGRPSWMDRNFYPVEKQLFEGQEVCPDATLLVDIGGGYGHDIAEFRSKFPNACGRLVLQDLPDVIDGIKQLDGSIIRMKHDFYTEQPVKAARAYYLHSVLHDWPDNECKSILGHIAGAMKKGYSRLLINENVIPDRNADWQATALDMMMITLFSSKERTASDWSQLLESPGLGLKIVQIWSNNHSQESLIECELC